MNVEQFGTNSHFDAFKNLLDFNLQVQSYFRASEKQVV